MKKLALLATLAAALFASQSAVAEITLPAVIGSQMVLQREQELPIWGWADPGEEVTVTIGDSKESATADALGRWKVKLPAMKAGGPHTMSIAGKNTIELTDILVGEVWVASGQSNMQWAVSQSQNAQEEISAATHPKIRLFDVPRVPSGTPANDVEATWKECNPQNVAGYSAVAYFFGRELQQELDVPIGLIATSWGGTRIEPWIPPAGFASQQELASMKQQVAAVQASYQGVLKKNLATLRPWLEAAEKAAAAGEELPNPPNFPIHPLASNGAPTGLYNGMVHPLVPFGIRGAIWYQGESNRGQGMQYHTLMKALIGGWREVWGQGDFPFYYVQLAPYKYGGNAEALAEIWEAQTATLAVPNTGMAVTTDIGNVADIHPANKHDVGKRLALWALANTYGKEDLVYSGPLYDSMEVEVDQIRIKFKHAEGGLAVRDDKQLTWFTIAGEDRKFVPATATIDGSTLLVDASSVSKPVAVRFGWNELAEPNLTNKAGLPASPFRTDKWDASQPAFPDAKK